MQVFAALFIVDLESRQISPVFGEVYRPLDEQIVELL